MSSASASAALELLLARLYGDESQLARFLADRHGFARECGVDAGCLPEIDAIDEDLLRFSVGAYANKRVSR